MLRRAPSRRPAITTRSPGSWHRAPAIRCPNTAEVRTVSGPRPRQDQADSIRIRCSDAWHAQGAARGWDGRGPPLPPSTSTQRGGVPLLLAPPALEDARARNRRPKGAERAAGARAALKVMPPRTSPCAAAAMFLLSRSLGLSGPVSGLAAAAAGGRVRSTAGSWPVGRRLCPARLTAALPSPTNRGVRRATASARLARRGEVRRGEVRSGKLSSKVQHPLFEVAAELLAVIPVCIAGALAT